MLKRLKWKELIWPIGCSCFFRKVQQVGNVKEATLETVDFANWLFMFLERYSR